MKVVVITSPGASYVLQVYERPHPKPAREEGLAKVAAAASTGQTLDYL